MKNYKLFGKIPVFDIFIVLALAAVVLVAFNISDSSEAAPGLKKTTVRYTVEFQEVSAQLKNIPNAGETVRDHQTNTEIGAVVSAKSMPCYLTVCDTVTGEMVTSIQQDKQNIEVVIEADAVVSDSGVSINGIRFGLGRTFLISMPSIYGNSIVRNIEISEV